MAEQSTALIAYGPMLSSASSMQILNKYDVYVRNRNPINTKETVLIEIENTKPTYAFVYSGLPGVVSIEEVVMRSKQVSPKTKIVLIINENDASKILNYLLLNVDSIIWGDCLFETLEFALKRMIKGEIFSCGKTSLTLRSLLQQKNLESRFDVGLLGLLTDRELEVLYSLTQGKNYKQISQHLFISESTVKTHINNIFTKLNVNDRTQAVLYALRHGIETVIKKPQVIQTLVGVPVQQ